MIEIISACLLLFVLLIMIHSLYIVIHGALRGIDVAPPDIEKLAPQLEEWLSAQRPTSYSSNALAEIFNTSNRAINGSMTALLRKNIVGYDIIDNVKYYYYRED